ncbi:MAG: MFS transporter [Candidatus Lokiarchaeota archaeon]|nr:MFS transporter [Candidatus Lokiarchaeota archaeon]
MGKQTFGILILLTLFSSALFSIITPMAKELTLALNLNNEGQVAYINSLFLMVGAFSSLLWAYFADKYSRKWLLVISSLEWSVLTVMTIFAYDFYSFLLFQMIAAIGFGAALPLIYSLTLDLVSPLERGKKFGLLSAIYVMGNGLGQMLSGFLIDFYTWQVPLLIIGIGGIICTILLLIVEEPIRGAMEKSRKQQIEDVIVIDYKIRKGDLKKVWKIKTTFWIIIFSFAIFIAIGAISSFLISMFKNDFKFPSYLATILLIIIFGSQIPSGLLFGNIGDKRYETNKKGRIQIILLCLFVGSIIYIFAYSMILISFNEITTMLFIFLIFFGAFMFGGIDPLIQATLGDINPPQIQSTIYSLNYIGTTFGRSISLIILGYLFGIFNNQYLPGYLFLSVLAFSVNLILIPIFVNLPKDLKRTEA